MRILPFVAGIALVAGCGAPTHDEYLETEGHRVELFFNDPGTSPRNNWNPDIIPVMVNLIDGTNVSLDLATMGFSDQPLIDAIIRAYDRGVKVRFVGDADHLGNSGYQQLYARHIPVITGNSAHIMHSKFFVSDSRFVFAGTGNWEDSDLIRNWNNFVVMDSPDVAADFTAEFEQMWNGVFGSDKATIDNGNTYQLGDTQVEVWFSPDEDTMGRVISAVDDAQQSVHFGIFAFTKDQLGSAMLAKSEVFGRENAVDGAKREVRGVIDKSQLHSNGQYHEVYRLIGGGVPVREDGDDDETMPGDYQAGGGRLHSKTMVLDDCADCGGTGDPTVLTGSFNWSASATQSNDEFLLVMKGQRVADMVEGFWQQMWETGRTSGGDRVGEPAKADPKHTVAAGDVVINEVFWYGVTSTAEADGNDQFIELRNTTDTDLDISLWQIRNAEDTVVGLPPTTIIPAHGLFTILDHTLETYVDGAPQSSNTAFEHGDYTVNTFNDNRQSRLYLKDGEFGVTLMDPVAAEVDVAGDGGPPFAGGPHGSEIRSMERNDDPGDGSQPANWHACSLDAGGANVNPAYASTVIATPGEPNSPDK